eukprot:gene27341-4638_t
MIPLLFGLVDAAIHVQGRHGRSTAACLGAITDDVRAPGAIANEHAPGAITVERAPGALMLSLMLSVPLTGHAGQLKVALIALYQMEFSAILPATPAAAHAGMPEYGVVLWLQSLAILWFLCPLLVCLHECAHSFTAHTAQLQTRGSGGCRGGASADQTTNVTMSDFFSLRALAFLPLYLLTGRPRITPPQVNVHILIPGARHLSGLTSASHHVVDDIIRHAGWILSTLLAMLLSGTFHNGWFLHVLAPLDPVVHHGFIFYPMSLQLGALSAAWLVALSAISSDLLLLSPHSGSASDIVAGQARVVHEAALLNGTTFFCGNLGMLIAGVAESAVDYARVLRTQQNHLSPDTWGSATMITITGVSSPYSLFSSNGNSRYSQTKVTSRAHPAVSRCITKIHGPAAEAEAYSTDVRQ